MYRGEDSRSRYDDGERSWLARLPNVNRGEHECEQEQSEHYPAQGLAALSSSAHTGLPAASQDPPPRKCWHVRDKCRHRERANVVAWQATSSEPVQHHQLLGRPVIASG